MIKILIWLLLATGPLLAAPIRAADVTIDTPQLSVSDATGRLSNEQLKRLAHQAQETLDRVLVFWSADAGTGRFGKIRVIFDEPRRDVYSSVFYWEGKGDQRTRIVRVFGTEGASQMLAHKLTSAVFPQEDKLIRNLMGILAEARTGNPMTFPMCGFSSDDWVLALLEMRDLLPLNELGPDHESWGMRDSGGGRLSIHDKARQHKTYAEAGSFGNYLFTTYDVNKIKQLQKRSHERARPWREVFGADMPELEAGWMKSVQSSGTSRPEAVSALRKLLGNNAATACAEAQKLSSGIR